MTRIGLLVLMACLALFGCGGGGSSGSNQPGEPAPSNNNADLAALSISEGTLDPAFDPDVVNYATTVSSGTSSIIVTAQTADVNALLTINGSNTASGAPSSPVAIDAGQNEILVEVLAEDRSTRKVYTIAVSRPLRLSELSTSAGQLDPTFDPATLSYRVTVSAGTSEATITARTPVEDASIIVNGITLAGDNVSAPITLGEGATVVPVVLTSASSEVTTNYEVTFDRPSGNTKLARLSVSRGDLEPVFDPNRRDYLVSVSILVTELRITATPESNVAEVSVNGLQVAPGVPSAPIPVTDATSEIDIVVTAEDDSSDVYILTVERRSEALSEITKLTGTITDFNDFGASMDLEGDTLVIGSPGQSLEAAFVFVRRADGQWVQEARLTASNGEIGDLFGETVTVFGDIIAVGAPGEDSGFIDPQCNADALSNDLPNSGAVYVFRRSGNEWIEEKLIKGREQTPTGGLPCDAESGDNFGSSVAIYQSTLAIGGIGRQATWIYETNESGDWLPEDRVDDPRATRPTSFGNAVDLYADTLVVAAKTDESSATGINGDEFDTSFNAAGAVFVYRRSGSDWNREAYLKASNTGREDRFGHAISLDRDFLAVGALWEESAAIGIDGDETDDSLIQAGAVYLFHRSGSNWQQEAYIKASNTGSDAFGSAVALHDNFLIVGAEDEASAATGINGDQQDDSASGAGAGYLFVRDENGFWSQIAYIKASEPVRGFGSAAALGASGLAISATTRTQEPGKVFIFD